jgi:hypothetical protein
MNDDHKKFTLEVLRTEFMQFMNKVSKMPGSMIQKQAAFMRFDEGHMWMQNAVATFVEPTPALESKSIPEQPVSEHVKDEPQVTLAE